MNTHTTWITRALEKDLDPTERAEFLHALEHDAALRETFVRYAQLHGLLGLALEPTDAHKNLVAACLEAAGRQRMAASSSEEKRKIVPVHFRRRALWAAAAVFLVSLVGIWSLYPSSHVAIVMDASGSAVGMPAPNTRFAAGEKLALSGGLVELDLAGHGRMILEGPAEITWLDALSCRLESGRALFKINESGHGYRVDTPHGSITDLGTEFGVAVDAETGNVETHVFTGEVEARSTGADTPVRLGKNEALRITSSESKQIAAAPGEFYRFLPAPRRQPLGMIHWSMDALDNPTVVARTQHLDGDSPTLTLHNSPRSVEGRFGNAMYLNGSNTYAESDYHDIGGDQASTVAFWLKVPSGLHSYDHYNIISWHSNRVIWRLSLNHDPGVGEPGALRIGLGHLVSIGTTNLRDDQWHHIAVVLLTPESPDAGHQVMVYLDGELHPISRRTMVATKPSVDNDSQGVSIGRLADGFRGTWRYFRGSIDELYMFDNALTQAEIRTLLETNKAPADTGL